MPVLQVVYTVYVSVSYPGGVSTASVSVYDQNGYVVGSAAINMGDSNQVGIVFATSNLITSLTANACAQVNGEDSMMPACGSSTIPVSGPGTYYMTVYVYT
jgi:molecular chaperone DnaK (HSP70)